MSDNKALVEFPLMDTFLSGEDGLRKWRPIFDTISVDLSAKGVRLHVQKGEISLDFDLTPNEAEHLSRRMSAVRQDFLQIMNVLPREQPQDHQAD